LGGELQIVQEPGYYSETGRYLILTTTEGFSGAFSSLVVQGLPGFTFTVQQDGYDVYLVYTVCPPLAPTDVQGRQKDHLCSGKRVNVIKWCPPTGGTPVTAYLVYRNDNLIGVVSAKDELKFVDYLCPGKARAYTYYVKSVDRQKVSSLPASVTIVPKKSRHKHHHRH
jgi:hypothetical protein